MINGNPTAEEWHQAIRRALDEHDGTAYDDGTVMFLYRGMCRIHGAQA